MESTLRRKLVLYLLAFAIVVASDGLKYIFLGGPNIINWQSFAHPSWVMLAIAILAVNIYFWREKLFYFSFIIYLLVFISAFINQYIPFSETLTYNCMLFNLVFVSIYYLFPQKTNSV